MSHDTVSRIYEQRLADWAVARSLRVAYEGVEFEPDSDETYLRAFTLPAATSTQTLQGNDRLYTGLFQVNVIGPAGQGAGDVRQLADEIDTLFPAFMRIKQDALEVMVLTPVDPGPVIVDGVTLTVPVSFQYRANTI